MECLTYPKTFNKGQQKDTKPNKNLGQITTYLFKEIHFKYYLQGCAKRGILNAAIVLKHISHQ